MPVFAVTQEFGTVDSLTVVRALIRENAAFHHGTDQNGRMPAPRALELLRDAFNPPSNTWQSAILKRGLRAIDCAVSFLLK